MLVEATMVIAIVAMAPPGDGRTSGDSTAARRGGEGGYPEGRRNGCLLRTPDAQQWRRDAPEPNPEAKVRKRMAEEAAEDERIRTRG